MIHTCVCDRVGPSHKGSGFVEKGIQPVGTHAVEIVRQRETRYVPSPDMAAMFYFGSQSQRSRLVEQRNEARQATSDGNIEGSMKNSRRFQPGYVSNAPFLVQVASVIVGGSKESRQSDDIPWKQQQMNEKLATFLDRIWLQCSILDPSRKDHGCWNKGMEPVRPHPMEIVTDQREARDISSADMSAMLHFIPQFQRSTNIVLSNSCHGNSNRTAQGLRGLQNRDGSNVPFLVLFRF